MTRPHFNAVALPLLLIAIIVLGIAWTVSANSTADEQYAKYQNDRWRFSLPVPADMSGLETDQLGGVQHISFTDPTNDKQFTITATPYSQYDLTLDQEGAPDGVTDQPSHLEIINVVREDVTRVWFTKDGVLYTVLTLPRLEAWLFDLLKSWRFTD